MEKDIAVKCLTVSHGLLTDSEIHFLDNHYARLHHQYSTRQPYRTITQMRVAILNDTKLPTPSGKYWQCVLEQGTMYAQLIEDGFTYRRESVKHRLMLRELERINEEKEQDYDLHAEALQIEIEATSMRIDNIRVGARDRVRELCLWHELMTELLAEHDINTEDRDAGEAEYLTQRYKNQIEHLGANARPEEINNLMGGFKEGLKQQGIQELLSKIAEGGEAA